MKTIATLALVAFALSTGACFAEEATTAAPSSPSETVAPEASKKEVPVKGQEVAKKGKKAKKKKH